MTTSPTPEARRAIIAQLASLASKKHYNLGKTALQKHCYFLQTLFFTDCGYDFRLYTYGPFDSQLLADLDEAEMYDAVNILFDSSIGGYRIRPGAMAKSLVKTHSQFISGISDKLENVLDEFGPYNAKELELRATIVYAEREAEAEGRELEIDALVSAVKAIKPHFSHETIRSAIEELAQKEHIEVAA